MKKTIFIILTLLLITSCTTSEQIPSEISNPVEIYFCPRDNCEQHFIDFIESAKFSLHCALFDLKLENVINTLAEKSKTPEKRKATEPEQRPRRRGRRGMFRNLSDEERAELMERLRDMPREERREYMQERMRNRRQEED